MQQEPPPMLIGERCNAQGSRKFKRLLLAEDYDAILELGRAQVEGGAHALDISVAVTERADEAELMRKVVKNAGLGCRSAAGDRHHRAGGDGSRPEDRPGALPAQLHPPGRRAAPKPTGSLPWPSQHNAAVLVLTIDEAGHGQDRPDASWKSPGASTRSPWMSTACAPDDLVFDALTFTLATGDPEFANSAHRDDRRHPPDQGGTARRADLAGRQQCLLWSEPGCPPGAQQRDAVPRRPGRSGYGHRQPGAYHPLRRDSRRTSAQLAEDLIFNRRPDALQRFIEYFEPTESTAGKRRRVAASDPTEGMTPAGAPALAHPAPPQGGRRGRYR